MSLKFRRTITGLDHSQYPRMLDGLRQRPPTQQGYDLAISFAEGFLDTFDGFVEVGLSFANLFLVCGAGVIAFALMYAYAARQLARSSQVDDKRA